MGCHCYPGTMGAMIVIRGVCPVGVSSGCVHFSLFWTHLAKNASRCVHFGGVCPVGVSSAKKTLSPLKITLKTIHSVLLDTLDTPKQNKLVRVINTHKTVPIRTRNTIWKGCVRCV